MPNTRKDTQNTHRSPSQPTTSAARKICECVDEGQVELLPSRTCWQVLAGPTQSWLKAEYWARRADRTYQFGYLFANLAAVSRQLWWRYPFALSVVTAL